MSRLAAVGRNEDEATTLGAELYLLPESGGLAWASGVRKSVVRAYIRRTANNLNGHSSRARLFVQVRVDLFAIPLNRNINRKSIQ